MVAIDVNFGPFSFDGTTFRRDGEPVALGSRATALLAALAAARGGLVGKEALMQLGLGTMALGLSFLFRQQLLAGLMVAVSGGWLVWVVRPHLLAMVAILVLSLIGVTLFAVGDLLNIPVLIYSLRILGSAVAFVIVQVCPAGWTATVTV